jgi:hypothetical protein
VAQAPSGVEPESAKEIEQLIEQLGDPQFLTREKAQKRLIDIGPLATPHLERARASTDPEIVIRAKAVLVAFAQARLKRAEVHVVGLYESDAEKTVVRVTPTEHPLILVLCAYEPVTWDVHIPRNAEVLQIILSGYHAQNITDIDVPVVSMSYDERTPGYFYSYDHNEERFPRMVKRVHELTGKVPQTFQGRYGYKARPFVVPFAMDQYLPDH